MAIFLTKELAAHLAAQEPDKHTGCLEYGRYSATARTTSATNDEFVAYAWVNNQARRIGVMSRDGKHGLWQNLDGYASSCFCGRWRAANRINTRGPMFLEAWRDHAKVKQS